MQFREYRSAEVHKECLFTE